MPQPWIQQAKDYTPRFRSRIYAIQSLYSLEINAKDIDATIHSIKRQFPDKDKIYEFTHDLVAITVQNQTSIESKIQEFFDPGEVERLPVLTRIILKAAISEFRYFNTIPVEATINEALELGRFFGLDDTLGLINAILDKIAVSMAIKKPEDHENSDH